MTLRFCGRSGPRGRVVWRDMEPLAWHDIEVFLLFPELEEFAIDDSLPLRLSGGDMDIIASRGSRFRWLWLNPYPTLGRGTEGRDMGFPIESLVPLARSCRCLQILGVFVRADEGVHEVDFAEVTRFQSLLEFSVGWSWWVAMLRSALFAPCSFTFFFSYGYGRSLFILAVIWTIGRVSDVHRLRPGWFGLTDI